MAETKAPLGLVGDIGGTNARFAFAALDGETPQIDGFESFPVHDFPTAEAAAGAFLARHGDRRPNAAALAVAGPIENGAIAFTNSDWTLSEAGFSAALGLRATRLLNDYEALALAAPILGGDALQTLGPAIAGAPDHTIAVMGPGTGFGVSALVRGRGRQAALCGEGGHIGFAPGDDLEIEIWRVLGARFGRVSIERILSGPGLANLHGALAAIKGAPARLSTPAEITTAAEAGDAAAMETLSRFCEILGAVAGDFALAYGARGGVLIAGGVSTRLAMALAAGGFRRRFEAKGRFEAYVRAIPTALIRDPARAALLGAARALIEPSR